MFASMALKAYAGKAERVDLVNISSLAAIQGFKSWGVYCIGKAARDMLIQVIASETDPSSNVGVLNYAPGPVNTDMQKEIRTSAPVHEQRELYTSMFETGKLVSPTATSSKLVSIIERGDYKSGSHLDFYDA